MFWELSANPTVPGGLDGGVPALKSPRHALYWLIWHPVDLPTAARDLDRRSREDF